MRFLHIFIFLFLANSAHAASFDKIYIEDTQIELPANWQIKMIEKNWHDIVFPEQERSKNMLSAGLVIDKQIVKDLDLLARTYPQTIEKEYRQRFTNINVLDNQKVTNPNRRYYKISFTMKYRGKKLYNTHYLWYADGKYFKFITSAKEKSYKSYEAIFKQVFQSIKVRDDRRLLITDIGSGWYERQEREYVFQHLQSWEPSASSHNNIDISLVKNHGNSNFAPNFIVGKYAKSQTSAENYLGAHNKQLRRKFHNFKVEDSEIINDAEGYKIIRELSSYDAKGETFYTISQAFELGDYVYVSICTTTLESEVPVCGRMLKSLKIKVREE